MDSDDYNENINVWIGKILFVLLVNDWCSSGLKQKCEISFRKKIEIFDLHSINENIGVRILEEKFQVRKFRITDMVLNKDEIYKLWHENGNNERKLTKLRKRKSNVTDNKVTVTVLQSIVLNR